MKQQIILAETSLLLKSSVDSAGDAAQQSTISPEISLKDLGIWKCTHRVSAVDFCGSTLLS